MSNGRFNMKILLQFPEGLKREALAYAKKYEKEGHEVFIASASCFGACDLALEEAKAVGAKKIVHFGHSIFIRKKLPIEVEYVECESDFDIEVLKRSLTALSGFKNIAIATTIQYSHKIPEIKKFFEQNGKRVFIGKGSLAFYPGQVLGCDATALTQFRKEVDTVIFIGDGLFHPLAMDVDTPAFVIYPRNGDTKQINKEIDTLRKKRKGALLAAVDANSFGILVSTKFGQSHLKIARWAKKQIQKRGKYAAILIANEFEPFSLNNFMSFDCYVNTACPRMSDDLEKFGKPMLGVDLFGELLKILDELSNKTNNGSKH